MLQAGPRVADPSLVSLSMLASKSRWFCIYTMYVYLREVTIDVIRLTDEEATLPSLHSSMFFVTFAIKHLLKASVSPVSCQEEIGN